jgi:hypothetical protein
MEVPLAAERPLPGGQVVERDEILPSEEITQGTQPLKDNLMPQETEEALKNPFDEEPAFEEISVAPAAAASSPPLEYEKDPLARPAAASAGGGIKDASDEFHERFLEIANEDTSEDLLKPSLNAPLADSDDAQFPGDLKEETPPAAEEKFTLEFEKTDLGSPAQTLYAGSDIMAGFKAAAKSEKPKGAEPPAEKARPETLSPQDELAKLAGPPKKEPKAEAKASAQPPPPDKFEMTGKLEEKLGMTIRELLWEIVPPMAEKIIKEEIDKIKAELNDNSL